jgi:hypothetical protein
MSDLRELADAELDIVGGGAQPFLRREPSQGGVIKLVEEVFVDVLRLLEPQKPNRAVPYN